MQTLHRDFKKCINSALAFRSGWSCVGEKILGMAVLGENEATFPSFVPPCSVLSSASKSRADLYKITQNRKIKVDIFYAAHHLRNPWQTQDLQETELLTSRITNQASSHMALLFKWLPCKSQNQKSDSSALPLTVSEFGLLTETKNYNIPVSAQGELGVTLGVTQFSSFWVPLFFFKLFFYLLRGLLLSCVSFLELLGSPPGEYHIQ